VGDVSELSIVPSMSLCFYDLDFYKGRGFDSHRGQANFSACPVWTHSDKTSQTYIFTGVHNTRNTQKINDKLILVPNITL
jgi:hypothetical protein